MPLVGHLARRIDQVHPQPRPLRLLQHLDLRATLDRQERVDVVAKRQSPLVSAHPHRPGIALPAVARERPRVLHQRAVYEPGILASQREANRQALDLLGRKPEHPQPADREAVVVHIRPHLH